MHLYLSYVYMCINVYKMRVYINHHHAYILLYTKEVTARNTTVRKHSLYFHGSHCSLIRCLGNVFLSLTVPSH